MTDHLARATKFINQYGMSVSSLSECCPDCGAEVPQVPDGPTHPYFGASSGCWALYTVMLGREFGHWDAGTHRLSVDTYAVQHPGTSRRQAAINSVGIHLTALCFVCDKDMPVELMIRTMGDLGKGRLFEVHYLEPPEQPFPMTIVDLIDATTPEEYNARIRRWAETTWETWSVHHDQVREWANLTWQQVHGK